MSVLNKIAYFQNRRDEVPNQELAKELAETRDIEGIQEIVANLKNKNQNVQSDCLKVLYEIGYLAPDLIAGYVDLFLELLDHKNNRMVWGGMIALGTIAQLKPDYIYAKVNLVISTIDKGTVITMVWGIKTLSGVASTNPAYRQRIFPTLLKYLQSCIARDVPLHAENMLCTVDKSNLVEFQRVLETRKAEMTTSQLARLRKIEKQLQKK
jgi:hypothetical protein